METPKMIREHAPVITNGIRIATVDNLAIVDFIDAPDDEQNKIVFSVALTKRQAKSLSEQLSEIFKLKS